ncbi:MAG: RHS repeat-associated core domain-containing protein, partial [Candidatus Methanofastidiosa archaeon]|nr:RHS repeat-associated core domain-containing protein [Candidatus Methanofastidiosa archaeon]
MNEADIGLYYFGARWYDASLGRFISEDPLKGSMISPQSQNPYVYCMNNPLRFVDPSGMTLADDPGYVPGCLETYYGGEYHYFPAMNGYCNVSGLELDYGDAVAWRNM